MAEKRKVFKFLSLFFLAVAGISVSFMGDYLYKFNYHRNQLNFYIANSEQQSALAELNNLKYFDSAARSWKLGWLVDRYLITEDNIIVYDAIVKDYMIQDYNKVAGSISLQGINNYQAFHLIGSAKVRILQARYRDEKDPKAKQKLMAVLVKEMMEDANEYFKKAVEASPNFSYPDPNFDDRWNYDITSDEESAKKVIENQQPGKKYILGIPEGLKSGDKNPRGEKRLNEESKPGAGPDAKKKG